MELEHENMERLTRISSNKDCYVTDAVIGKLGDEGYYGEAIDKLAQFENLYDHLITRQEEIPKELEVLRQEGKSKTVKFRELFFQKLTYENFLILLRAHAGK